MAPNHVAVSLQLRTPGVSTALIPHSKVEHVIPRRHPFCNVKPTRIFAKVGSRNNISIDPSHAVVVDVEQAQPPTY
jgi:hypothetical protein